jgi:hypothetical protein
MKTKDIQGRALHTYMNLRMGIAILAIVLPITLWIGGSLLADLPLQDSMSAYYHSGAGAMRDVFTGFLFAIGVSLWLYKGVTWLEDIALNLAAFFLLMVALFPMEWDCGSACSRFSLHGICAVIFFCIIAYVCIFRASDTLSLISDEAKVTGYMKVYRLLGIAMVISPLIAVLLTLILQPGTKARSFIFFAETAGVYVFALYWIIKTREIARSGYQRLAAEGKLATRQYRAADIFKRISVDRVEKVLL